MYAFGMAMGPYRAADESDINDLQQVCLSSRNQVCHPLEKALQEKARWGRCVGKGWYQYAAEKGGGFSTEEEQDPEVDAMIDTYRRALGITPSMLPETEIVTRYSYALVNEGAKILEAGIANRASDIDITCVLMNRFPAFRGGPMFYADTIGLGKVVEGIEAFHQRFKDKTWRPSELLLALAADGKRLQDFDAT